MEEQLSELTALTNALWVLVSGALVFFMHAGFALVESGFCRKKNAVMVLMKNVGVVAISSIAFYLVGYGVMFGEGNTYFGLTQFFPDNGGAYSDLPPYVFLFFQLVFAATSCTIVSGAIAERGRLSTFFAFTAIATIIIYPVVGHWVWGGGWLSERGFIDFAGSTVVHGVGGGMALAGALIIGPRIGKYLPDGSVKPMPAHNFPLATLGVIILWLGWFGFNGGSELAFDADVGRIVLVTNLAAAAGFVGALAWIRVRSGLLDLSMALNGALAGLVGITAGCYTISGGWALVVGILAGVICVEGVLFIDKIKIDDPVGQLGVQVLGTFSGVAFAFVVGGILWLGMKFLVPGGVRVSEAHEIEGLDIAECGVEAYNEELTGVHAGTATAMSAAPAE